MVPKVSLDNYDFSGWATRNNIKCTDGRVIAQDAFVHDDQKIVPLVWGHMHDDPSCLIGQALLVNKPEGVRAYGLLNNNPKAQAAKEGLRHGDIHSLSICAGELKHKLNEVVHGAIKEVSLVVSGANPGAFIDDICLTHSDGTSDVTDEAIIYFGEELELTHADKPKPEEKKEEKKEEEDVAEKEEKGKTLEDVYNTLNEDQKLLVHALVGEALESGKGDSEDEEEVKHSDEGGEFEMKYNVFDGSAAQPGTVLTHADEEAIMAKAKTSGYTFQSALKEYAETTLQHYDGEIAPVGGFNQTTDQTHPYSIDTLFPEYKEVRPGAPELITDDQGWVGVVLQKVHKSPISRIRTTQVDIRAMEELKGKGYVKGRKKALTGNFTLLRRTTDPQTVYVKNALHRDDIIDMTEFDYVQYLYNIDKMQLNETLATAIMLGDGRSVDSDDKIFPEHIRPIWTDDDLYTLHVDLDLEAARAELQGSETDSYFGDNYITAEAMVNTLLYARENFKGTGTPDCFMTPHMLNVMLLARDRNGRRIYSSKQELASTLNVGAIYTAEQFANKTRTDSQNRTKKLHAIVCNLADYALGSTKGGEVTHFTQFDIDFNQQKSLLETRCSGALTRVYSAIAVEEIVTGD